MSVSVGRIFESVCLSVCLSEWSQSVQTWYREWPWDTLELYCFGVQRSKVTITLHFELQYNHVWFTFARWRYQYYNITTTLHCHSLLATVGGDTDKSNTAWVSTLWVHSSLVCAECIAHKWADSRPNKKYGSSPESLGFENNVSVSVMVLRNVSCSHHWAKVYRYNDCNKYMPH